MQIRVLHVQLLARTTLKSKMECLGALCSFPTVQKKVASALYFYTVWSSDAVSSDPDYDPCSVPVAFAVWMFSCPDSESTVCSVHLALLLCKINCCVYFYISVYSSVGDGTFCSCPR